MKELKKIKNFKDMSVILVILRNFKEFIEGFLQKKIKILKQFEGFYKDNLRSLRKAKEFII